MKLRCWVEINTVAFRRNLSYLRSCVSSKTQIIAIVKANGFGHGMIRVAKCVMQSGANALGVASLQEARELREAGLKCPILLLSAALPSEYSEIIRLKLWPFLSTMAEAKALDRCARQLDTVAEAHFKMDTGMGRLGLWQDEAGEALTGIFTSLLHVRIVAVATHLSQAETNAEFTRNQLEEFAEFSSQFPGLPIHVSNSASTCLRLVYQADFVRVGLAVYGIAPIPRFSSKLEPALTWKSRICLLRDLPAGRTLSYGATYQLPKPATIATVAVGYGDGYPRSLSNVGHVLIGGRRCPIRGRVTMDQILVDVSNVPRVRVEDEVVLMGEQGKSIISATDLAKMAGMIPYDILTSISARVTRIYQSPR